MAVNIHNIIAAINPNVFCEKNVEENDRFVSLRDKVKAKLEEGGYTLDAYIAASELAKPVESGALDFNEEGGKNSVYYSNPFDLVGIKNPVEKHALTYDSMGQNLEPIYFWLLDNINQELKSADKLVDNFISSPGSGHFSEMGMKSTKMQEEAMKMLGSANQVVKSILTLIYDLKEWRIRLSLYNKLNKSKDEGEKASAIYSLKQIWMDTVDAKRGNTSIKGLALGQQSNFVTLIDAFMKVNDFKEIDKIDLNDRVRRILQQRLGEFLTWLKESEQELRKRYEIEKIYLKSQINTVQLYARWAKPYLKAAQQLEQRASPSAALVTAFNTTLFELTLMGQDEYKPEDDVNKGDLPAEFAKTKMRKYIPLLIVELKFRSIPERAGQQGYGFRGRVEIVFTSYALVKEEIDLLKKIIDKDDFQDVFKFMEGATGESLDLIKDEIDSFLNENEEKEEKTSSKKDSSDSNPFSALFSGLKFFNFSSKEEKSAEKNPNVFKIKKDSDYEAVVRSMALIKARQNCRKMYGLYKKAHEMPAF